MTVKELALPGVRGLTPYIPGKPISELERELGLSNIIKLASNENPLGPSPKAVEAAARSLEALHLYPDGGGFELKRALSAHLGVAPEQITLGNGSNDVLDLVGRTFLGPERGAAFSEHAFAVYPIVAQAMGAVLQVAPAGDGSRGPRYGHDLEALSRVIDSTTRVVFLANPNNPTGTYLAEHALESFLNGLPDQTMVVIDEAYFEYVGAADYPDATRWLKTHPRLIVTRTFSKAFGLAGLRVGYAVSSPDTADLMNRVRQPFNVSLIALEAARAALEDPQHLEATVRLNREGLAYLEQALRQRGLAVIPSVGNFVTFDLAQTAQPVYEALLRAGVIVRPIANYGLPRHLRVTVGLDMENRAFIEALDRVLDR